MSKRAAIEAALCQMSSGAETAANLSEAERLIGAAADSGAELVCLPEMFACMGADPAAKQAAAEEPGSGPVQDFLAEQSARRGVYLAAGSLLIKGRKLPLNRSILYGPDGSVLGHYDKIHLFRFSAPTREYDETKEYEAGKQVVALATPLGRIGLSVCYDLRFPELYRQLGSCDVTLVPAAFTRTTGRDHWQVLLRARAIENQCFVLAAAQCGEHAGGLRTWGRSQAIDPWGKVIAELEGEPGVLRARLDLAALAAVRDKLPVEASRAL